MTELKQLETKFKEIKEKLGIKAFEHIEDYCFTLYRKIEDLIKSRENWKAKYFELKKSK